MFRYLSTISCIQCTPPTPPRALTPPCHFAPLSFDEKKCTRLGTAAISCLPVLPTSLTGSDDGSASEDTKQKKKRDERMSWGGAEKKAASCEEKREGRVRVAGMD